MFFCDTRHASKTKNRKKNYKIPVDTNSSPFSDIGTKNYDRIMKNPKFTSLDLVKDRLNIQSFALVQTIVFYASYMIYRHTLFLAI